MGSSLFNGGDPAKEDTDDDGLTDGGKYRVHNTRLDSNDTDGDGIGDFAEVNGFIHQATGKPLPVIRFHWILMVTDSTTETRSWLAGIPMIRMNFQILHPLTSFLMPLIWLKIFP